MSVHHETICVLHSGPNVVFLLKTPCFFLYPERCSVQVLMLWIIHPCHRHSHLLKHFGKWISWSIYDRHSPFFRTYISLCMARSAVKHSSTHKIYTLSESKKYIMAFFQNRVEERYPLTGKLCTTYPWPLMVRGDKNSSWFHCLAYAHVLRHSGLPCHWALVRPHLMAAVYAKPGEPNLSVGFNIFLCREISTGI